MDPDFPFPRASTSRVNVAQLGQLVDEAGNNQSNGLLVVQDGAIIVEKYFGKPPSSQSIQSVTKSVSSLAVGFLLQDELITLDTPLSKFYPEWGSGAKAGATLRHVLTMSTGIHDDPNGNFWKQNDLVAYARAQPLVTPPGKDFAYSDLAVELLAGVVAQLTGEEIDQYLKHKLFTSLGITDQQWFPDRAGNMQISGGLFFSLRDLARIGSFSLNRGDWKGIQLLPGSWFDASSTPSSANAAYGLLWWLDRNGAHPGSLTAPDPSTLGPVNGTYAMGYGGQWIVTNPASNLVAVRTFPFNPAVPRTPTNFMSGFPGKVMNLTPLSGNV